MVARAGQEGTTTGIREATRLVADRVRHLLGDEVTVQIDAYPGTGGRRPPVRPWTVSERGRTTVVAAADTHEWVRLVISFDEPRCLTAGELAHLETLSILLSREVAYRRQLDLLRAWSMEDPLTGLLNRRGLQLSAEAAMTSYRASGQALALGLGVMVIDVDGLKQVNDTFGHARGDRLLQDVAHLLSGTCPAVRGCLVARIGGDEFCVVVPDTDHDTVRTFAERLRSGAHQLPYGARLSIGLAVASPGSAADFAGLLLAADAAQCEAKRAGGDRVRVSSHHRVALPASGSRA